MVIKLKLLLLRALRHKLKLYLLWVPRHKLKLALRVRYFIVPHGAEAHRLVLQRFQCHRKLKLRPHELRQSPSSTAAATTKVAAVAAAVCTPRMSLTGAFSGADYAPLDDGRLASTRDAHDEDDAVLPSSVYGDVEASTRTHHPAGMSYYESGATLHDGDGQVEVAPHTDDEVEVKLAATRVSSATEVVLGSRSPWRPAQLPGSYSKTRAQLRRARSELSRSVESGGRSSWSEFALMLQPPLRDTDADPYAFIDGMFSSTSTSTSRSRPGAAPQQQEQPLLHRSGAVFSGARALEQPESQRLRVLRPKMAPPAPPPKLQLGTRRSRSAQRASHRSPLSHLSKVEVGACIGSRTAVTAAAVVPHRVFSASHTAAIYALQATTALRASSHRAEPGSSPASASAQLQVAPREPSGSRFVTSPSPPAAASQSQSPAAPAVPIAAASAVVGVVVAQRVVSRRGESSTSVVRSASSASASPIKASSTLVNKTASSASASPTSSILVNTIASSASASPTLVASSITRRPPSSPARR